MTNVLLPSNQLSFVPTFDDVYAAYRLSLPPARRTYLIALAAMIIGPIDIVLAVLLPLNSTETGTLVGIGIGVGGFVIGLLVLIHLVLARSILFKRKIKRIFAQQAGFRDQQEVTWNETGLAVCSPVGSAALPWERFTKFREGTAAFLLYQSDAMFHFLPKRTMTADQIDALRGQIAARVAQG